jgi:hypothetical protein
LFGASSVDESPHKNERDQRKKHKARWQNN